MKIIATMLLALGALNACSHSTDHPIDTTKCWERPPGGCISILTNQGRIIDCSNAPKNPTPYPECPA